MIMERTSYMGLRGRAEKAARKEPITVRSVCNALKKQAGDGEFFWRSAPPKDYTTGMLFGGFNFAILGTDPVNALDQRWLTDGERIASRMNPSSGAAPARILLFTRGEPNFRDGVIGDGGSWFVTSEDAWNVTQMSRSIPMPRMRMREIGTARDLRELLPLERIPYKSRGGIAYFNMIDKFDKEASLAFSPLELLRRLAAAVIPAVRTTGEADPVPGTPDAAFDELTCEIASCRIAATLNIPIGLDSYSGRIREIIMGLDFEKAENRMKMARSFADASEIERTLLTQSSSGIDELPEAGYEEVEPFLGVAEWNNIVRSDTHSQAWTLIIEGVKECIKQCRAAQMRDTAYLRYIPETNDELLEFYATGLSDSGIDGVILTSSGKFQITLAPDELHGSFTADLTWVPAPLSAI